MKKTTLVIGNDGDSRCLSQDTGVDLHKFGDRVDSTRCSRVETWANLTLKAKWWLVCTGTVSVFDLFWNPGKLDVKYWTDLLRVRGPVLGPFDDYHTAVSAELRWLEENDLPLPGDEI